MLKPFALIFVRTFIACAFLALFTSPFPALAQDQTVPPPPPTALSDFIPPQNTAPVEIAGQLPATEYPLLRLTPDKIEVLHLDRDAVNVIVGNSTHMLSVLETPRQILLIPRQPGATHFQALDAHGRTIMERSVIVASPKQDYVRVRRTCATVDGGRECQEYSIYYCPDMCHQIAVTQTTKTGGGADIPDETASTQTGGDMVDDGVTNTTDSTANGTGNIAGTIGTTTGVQ